MQNFEGIHTFDVAVSFQTGKTGYHFVRLAEREGFESGDVIDMDQFQAVAVAKEILKKYEPEALR